MVDFSYEREGDNMTQSELRKALKALTGANCAGYNCSFSTKQSPFSDKAVTFVYLILPNGEKVQITSACVFGKGFYEEHRDALALINQWRGKA